MAAQEIAAVEAIPVVQDVFAVGQSDFSNGSGSRYAASWGSRLVLVWAAAVAMRDLSFWREAENGARRWDDRPCG
jgi:hypothetical protein